MANRLEHFLIESSNIHNYYNMYNPFILEANFTIPCSVFLWNTGSCHSKARCMEPSVAFTAVDL